MIFAAHFREHRQRDEAERTETEIIERQRAVGGEAHNIGPRNV